MMPGFPRRSRNVLAHAVVSFRWTLVIQDPRDDRAPGTAGGPVPPRFRPPGSPSLLRRAVMFSKGGAPRSWRSVSPVIFSIPSTIRSRPSTSGSTSGTPPVGSVTTRMHCKPRSHAHRRRRLSMVSNGSHDHVGATRGRSGGAELHIAFMPQLARRGSTRSPTGGRPGPESSPSALPKRYRGHPLRSSLLHL
jgi:hypothetical protein